MNARREEFRQAALPHLGELVRVATRVLRDRPAAEDAVQETYLQAWKSFGTFQLGTNCRAWLYTIMFRVIGRQRKRDFAMRHVDLESAPPAALQVDTPPVDSLALEHLSAAVDDLADPYRTVLLLADVEQLKYREIADVLDLPMGTVMSRLSRARQQLRGAVAERTTPRVVAMRS
jgi:RNA polymerase sigma-70 factor (ECF subfamily)